MLLAELAELAAARTSVLLAELAARARVRLAELAVCFRKIKHLAHQSDFEGPHRRAYPAIATRM